MEKDIDETDLEIWKTVVSVQMHFNDLELRIRNFAIISLGAILTVAGYSLRENNQISIGELTIPFASLILFIGVIVWLCFWFMDRHWYHRLLLGSVYHGIKIEERYELARPSIGLSATIKENSPYSFLGRQIRSQHRLNFFYWTIAIVLLTVAIAMFSLSSSIFFAISSALIGLIAFFVTTGGSEKSPRD